MIALVKVAFIPLCLLNFNLIATEKSEVKRVLLLQKNPSGEDVTKFFQSLPRKTLEKDIVFYFDVKNKRNYKRFLFSKEFSHYNDCLDELNRKIPEANAIEYVFLQHKKVVLIIEIIKIYLEKLKELKESENAVYTSCPPLIKKQGKYHATDKGTAPLFRVYSVFSIKVKYETFDIESSLEKLSSSNPRKDYEEIIFSLSFRCEQIAKLIKKHYKTFNMLAQSPHMILNKGLYSFLSDFHKTSKKVFGLGVNISKLTQKEADLITKEGGSFCVIGINAKFNAYNN